MSVNGRAQRRGRVIFTPARLVIDGQQAVQVAFEAVLFFPPLALAALPIWAAAALRANRDSILSRRSAAENGVNKRPVS